MRIYDSNPFPERSVGSKSRINACETDAKQAVAEKAAKRQLEQQARNRNADAIVDFSVSCRQVFAGYEVIASGAAIKLRR